MSGKIFRTVNYYLSIAFVSFVLFIGLMVVVTFIHEYTHYNDYKNLVVQDEFCVLNYNPHILKGNIGYYAFKYPARLEEEVNRLGEYAELRAYTTTIILMTIFGYSLLVIADRFIMQKLNIVDS